MTVDEELTFQKEWLELLYGARKDLALSGLAKRVEKGNVIVTYATLEEVNKAIRETKNSISILERSLY